jgi:putative Mg2+ transporter-C (MgtC) family protein
MQAWQNINLLSLADTLVSLIAAFLLGGLIGLERQYRQYRQRTAGLRTNVLVALGAAIFVDMANRLGGLPAPCMWSLTWFRALAFSAPA